MSRQGIVAIALRSTTALAPVVLLFGTLLFFLWMFLAAESLSETAAAGRFLSADRTNAVEAAERYAYEWRHGIAGGWPLYVPGFFAVAIATVLWSSGRALFLLVMQGVPALLIAIITAKLLAPTGTEWLLPSFEAETGHILIGFPVAATWQDALPGVLTLMSWVALVLSIEKSVARRSVRLLLAPLACYGVLALLRPGDLGDLVRPWAEALWRGETVAIVSTTLVPIITAGLLFYCTRSGTLPHTKWTVADGEGRGLPSF